MLRSESYQKTMSNPKLPPLNLPEMNLLTKLDGEILKVYDSLRKKYVALTPEEYVRQHFVNYLVNSLHYPASRLTNEIGIRLNGTFKRCDTVFFGVDGEPAIIVEYKAPSVNITQDVFDQIFRYNLKLKARYLIVSNGIKHYCCAINYENDSYHFIPQIPDYSELSRSFSDN